MTIDRVVENEHNVLFALHYSQFERDCHLARVKHVYEVRVK